MKKLFLILILCLAAFGCESLVGPSRRAELVLSSPIKWGFSPFLHPQFEGYVKNIGSASAYGAAITISCYKDEAKANLAAKIRGELYGGRRIEPTAEVSFRVIVEDLISRDIIRAVDTEITWRKR
jgi:hypothetical protein